MNEKHSKTRTKELILRNCVPKKSLQKISLFRTLNKQRRSRNLFTRFEKPPCKVNDLKVSREKETSLQFKIFYILFQKRYFNFISSKLFSKMHLIDRKEMMLQNALEKKIVLATYIICICCISHLYRNTLYIFFV